MPITTAEKVQQGDTILWHDSGLGHHGQFRVTQVSHYDSGRVGLTLKSSTGRRITWSGPKTAEITLPKRRR